MKDILTEILELCIYLDSKAAEIYGIFSETSETEDLKLFWKKISAEERGHEIFWNRLLELANKRMLPQIFDKPYELKEELQSTKSKIDVILKRSREVRSLSEIFLIAYRIEFYMLHPEFETLFHFIKTILNEPTPGEDYDSHLRSFLNALYKYRLESPELEFLGETIIRFRDMTSRVALQTHIDFLTGILNRRGLFDTIMPLAYLSRRNNYNTGIMMIDIDYFKNINDTHGHQTGDNVLRTVAQLIKSSVRSSDIVGRYGGEEFVVFLSPVDPPFLLPVAEKIRVFVEAETAKNIPVTISIGVSQGVIAEDTQQAVEALIRKADECLYEAKNSGRNRVVI